MITKQCPLCNQNFNTENSKKIFCCKGHKDTFSKLKTGKQKETVLAAKKKGQTKVFAKNKKNNRKSCRIAKRSLIDKPKG